MVAKIVADKKKFSIPPYPNARETLLPYDVRNTSGHDRNVMIYLTNKHTGGLKGRTNLKWII